MGKLFVASCVAELLPALREQGKVDENLEALHEHYCAWSRSPAGLRLHYSKFDKDTFGLGSNMTCPTGAWNKFADTRVFLAWLESFLASDKFVPSAITDEMVRATKEINRCFSLLYRSGVWLTKTEASTAGNHGMQFLHSYARLAHYTLQQSRIRFAMVPKVHFTHHPMLGMLESAAKRTWTVNPLTFSVQLDEDLVGQVSRSSRRVGSVKQMERTIGRWKIAAWLAMEGH